MYSFSLWVIPNGWVSHVPCATGLRTATHCDTLRHTATHWNTPNAWVSHFPCATGLRTAAHCNTLQRTATHCNTLRHTATHCNSLEHTRRMSESCPMYNWFTHCNTLQHTATHCNALEYTATYCNTPNAWVSHVPTTGFHTLRCKVCACDIWGGYDE